MFEKSALQTYGIYDRTPSETHQVVATDEPDGRNESRGTSRVVSRDTSRDVSRDEDDFKVKNKIPKSISEEELVPED